ncbi:hypothetical protein BKA62DRAFT_773040 [Auriculariales sp. MPI-PUGE-AT-0066]|nr:hypothetical protein BKA62DRAFT_773040 [Auriculariales sp. MPI-PUGE-AT-0066]
MLYSADCEYLPARTGNSVIRGANGNGSFSIIAFEPPQQQRQNITPTAPQPRVDEFSSESQYRWAKNWTPQTDSAPTSDRDASRVNGLGSSRLVLPSTRSDMQIDTWPSSNAILPAVEHSPGQLSLASSLSTSSAISAVPSTDTSTYWVSSSSLDNTVFGQGTPPINMFPPAEPFFPQIFADLATLEARLPAGTLHLHEDGCGVTFDYSPICSSVRSSDLPSTGDSSPTSSTPAPLSMALRRIHAFVPMLPLPLSQYLLAQSTQLLSLGDAQLLEVPQGRAFVAFALRALVRVTEIVEPNDTTMELDVALVKAQHLAMKAYLAALSQKQDNEDAPWTDSRALTAAGLVFLTVRLVFTKGWTSEAAAFLKLAAGLTESLPRNSLVRAWFARVIWLWDLGLVGATSPYGPPFPPITTALEQSLTDDVVAIHRALRPSETSFARDQTSSPEQSDDESPRQFTEDEELEEEGRPLLCTSILASKIPAFEGDADSCIFDSVVSLGLNLGKRDSLQGESGDYPELSNPLMVIQAWIESLPSELGDSMLHIVTVPPNWVRPPPVAPPGGSSSVQGRPAIVRSPIEQIISLLYPALCMSYYGALLREALWIDKCGQTELRPTTSLDDDFSMQRARELVRQTTIRAAMMGIIEVTDGLMDVRHLWLWPFVEQALVFAQHITLGRLPADSGPAGPSFSAPSPSQSMEEQLKDLAEAGLRMPADGPQQSILALLQTVLFSALDAFTIAPPRVAALVSGHVRACGR